MYHVEPSWSQQIGKEHKAYVLMTDKSYGNLSINQEKETLHGRQEGLVGKPWAYLEQVHGNSVIEITRAGEFQGTKGDALVTSCVDIPLSVQVADCAPVALFSEEGVLGVVHAGWRGVHSDVIGKTCFEMNKLGQAPSIAIVGPCIYPENYEFDRNDLAALEKTFGVGIKSKTKYGRPALDLPAMVRLALSKNGVKNVTYLDGCTADSEHFWSHRANCDQERQAMVAWIGNN